MKRTTVHTKPLSQLIIGVFCGIHKREISQEVPMIKKNPLDKCDKCTLKITTASPRDQWVKINYKLEGNLIAGMRFKEFDQIIYCHKAAI